MFNRRIAKILVLGAALMALPVMASAQMSRVEGMALQGDYIKDWSNIFTYTSAVANVGNLVYGELGNVNFPPVTFDRSVGAVVGTLWDGRAGTWAIHLREQTPNLGQGNASSQPGVGVVGLDPNVHTSEQFDIMWGKKFGTSSFGLRLNSSNTTAEGDLYLISGALGSLRKIENDDPLGDPNLARNILGVGAGVGFEMSPTSSAEINVLYQSRTFKHTDSTGVVVAEDDGGASYQVAARGMWQWQPNVTVVPVFKWNFFDLSSKTTPPGPTGPTESSVQGWQIGAAGNWALGANDLFVLGATVASNKFENFGNLVEVTETHMPLLFAALETHVNPWLTLRFGARKGAFSKLELTDRADSFTPGTVEIRRSSFEMVLGAGCKFGNLQLDAILDRSFVNNLPYFISGDDTSDMFTKVTATYPW